MRRPRHAATTERAMRIVLVVANLAVLTIPLLLCAGMLWRG